MTVMTARRRRPRLPARAICLLCGLLLAACIAMPTPYQPRDGDYGYSQQQIDSLTWRVEFTGNSVTPRATVDNYLMYRAAEVMKFGGYDRFVLLDKNIERTDVYYGSGYVPHLGTGWYDRGFGMWYSSPEVYRSSSRYAGTATVRAYTGGPPPANAPVFVVDEVMAQLAPTIVMPPPAGG